MCTLLPVAVNMASVIAVTRSVEVLDRKAIMDQKWESLFQSSEHGMKVLYDPDVYAVTCGGEHGEGDSCDEEWRCWPGRPPWTRRGTPASRAVNMG